MTPDPVKTHRTDAELFTEARHALDENPAVPAAVRVHLQGGIVTLTGSVRLPGERLMAEQTVRGIEGVRGVVNEIFVRDVPAAGMEPPDDADRFRQ
jgi:osmotically-inducible protein OsmY